MATPLDFPSNPSIGQIYNAPNGVAYQWDGVKWNVIGGTGVGGVGIVSIGSTAPTGPVLGQLWWRSDPDGNLYVWYNDGTSSQWVPAMAAGGGGGGGGPASGPAGGDLSGVYPNPSLGIVQASKLEFLTGDSLKHAPSALVLSLNDQSSAHYASTVSGWQAAMQYSPTDVVQLIHTPIGGGAGTTLFTFRADGTARVTTDPVNPLDLVTKQYVDGQPAHFKTIRTVTTSGAISPTDDLIINAATGAITLTLPLAASVPGKIYYFADAPNKLTVVAQSGDAIVKVWFTVSAVSSQPPFAISDGVHTWYQ